MEEILKFLQDAKTFFLATVEKDQPRVRPMGFVMVYEGKLSFCTNNKKEMFKQMKVNPKIEICASTPEGKWIRICGNADFNTSKAAKEKALEIMPGLKNMYSPDDGIFEIFHFENAIAVFSDMQGGKKEVKI
jgi:uncharacterized pyridoxamine 5'-phosphate oxidase family protein